MAAATNVSAVWLELLRAQRPMRYAEIAAALPELPHAARATALNIAFRLGYLTRVGEHRAYEYAVTPACNVPPGIPLVEVMEATA